jgi:Uncharacterized conserved protein
MANADRPTGLSPVGHISGSPYNGQAREYCILAANTNGFAIGDAVISAGGADGNGVPTITVAATTGPLRGVIVGLSSKRGAGANLGNRDSTVRPAAAQSTDWYAMVVDDPGVIYEIQEVSGGTALTEAAVGLNAPLVLGANNGFLSGYEVNNAGEVTTSSVQLRLLGLAQRADNAFGEHAKWLVLINAHELRAGSDGV